MINVGKEENKAISRQVHMRYDILQFNF
ncbi:MAG: hypothetical protein UX68_C0026G0019, partial [Parcubacteria group bacterium GW2011_GWA2_46_9]